MRDPCRICGVRLVGSQCRWIFSSSAQRKLQVILSHVLGREVTRDGQGEFLCGKCVFQLEKVVHCDVNISQLQEKHNGQIQKMQAEKDHLSQCIRHIYNKNNPSLNKSCVESTSSKTLLGSSGVGNPDDDDDDDDDAICRLASEGQLSRKSGSDLTENRMRRCVSLDRIVSQGAFPGRPSLRSSKLGSATGLDGSTKSSGLRGTRHRSHSMYLDLVQRKGILPRPEVKGRSTSLHSLNRDLSSDAPPDPPPKLKLREPTVFVVRHGAIDDPEGEVQATALRRSSSSQPSVISDLTQLLRCISRRHVAAPAGSHIPVLKRLNTGPPNPRAKHRHGEAKWKSLRDLTEEFDDKYNPVRVVESDVRRVESFNKQLSEELTQAKSNNDNLTKTLEETQNQNKSLLGKLEEKENDLNSEKKNALKRDKTIQGLTQVFKEKEKQIAELCHEIEDRDDALAKAREAAHKAQLQKYQGVEEHQTLLMAKQTELALLQGEHHAKVLDGQKLQRGLDRKEQELAELQQAKDQLEVEREDLQQQKKKGDKALNDLNNQLKKLSGEIGDRESALEQQYQEMLDQTKRKLQTHEVTIQRLTSTLTDKEQQLQEYINMVPDFEQSKSPGGNDHVLSKLRHRLKEKETALEDALDEKFAAIEEKDNEIHQLQLSLRERERDLDRFSNLLSHNEETINSFDSLIKEKDVELQHLANTLKNLQRAKQDVEDNLNRTLREKDSIISQLQLSLEVKTKDMEEMSESTLSQSQSHTRDLAEQMGQRLKVTEAMLAETVKARERLVADNESAVDGLLATISSKDQLIKESAEHDNRMLSERTQEIQQLRKQLADRQQELVAADQQSSATAQEGYLETVELRALLAEKDGIINKLLQRGQERDQFPAEVRQKEEPDHILELRQSIQIMQEKLDEKEEAVLSRKSSEENMENILPSKKTVVVLKKELAQKTEALNKALKRENELKMSLAELQSLLSELEGRNEGHAANVESLTATLKTKDEIIDDLHECLRQRGDSRADHTRDQVTGSGMERSLPALPQRERTMIGGDSQQEALPNLVALQQEHDALNKALRAEQQLYSSLVRTVKEQDSAQRLHALQLELTAVQLLRQQLEESIRTNEQLRDDLEREMHRAKLREGTDLVNPKELQSMRHQLEDAQRWNASLQARLGAIQNRGGGVGGANDGGDTFSFIGDQTSYMSICVGEGPDDSSSAPQLRQKVLELQECVSSLQAVNNELQNRLSLLERSDRDAYEDEDVASSSPLKQLEETQEVQPVAPGNRTHHSCQDEETQTDIKLGQTVSGKLVGDTSLDSGLGQSREHAQSGNNTLDTGERGSRQSNTDAMALQSLLTHCGATSVLHLREELLRLRSENVELRGLLKEQTSTECKEKESTDASGNSSDGQAELKRSVETLQAELRGQSKVINLLREKEEKNSTEASDGGAPVTTEMIVGATEGMKSQTKGPSSSKCTRQHGDGARSRLPVPVRLRVEASSSRQPVSADHLKTDALQHLHLDGVCRADQPPHEDSTSSPRQSTSSFYTLAYAHRTGSPVGSDVGSEAGTTPDHTQANSALFLQLELLHQDCQEKEAVINKLSERLADWEELHAELQEKDRLNRQYVEALQAAESTIAYLTACSLDSQGRFGSHTSPCTGPVSVGSDSAIYSRCAELQKALQEKEELNKYLVELLSLTETAIGSTGTQERGFGDLCLKIEMALQQANASSTRPSPRCGLGGTEYSMQELQRHTDSLQGALWQQDLLNAELQEKLRAADAAARHGYDGPDGKCSRQIAAESLKERELKGHQWEMGSYTHLNQEMSVVLMNCLGAAEAAVASLAAHCTNTSSSASGRSSQTGSEFQMNLDTLQRALQERQELGEPAQSTSNSSSSPSPASSGPNGQLHQELHGNLCRLFKVFGDHHHRISDLQASVEEEKGRREESEGRGTVLDDTGLPPSVQAELETLHKALREKRKACKSLEEKLATALTSPETARRALEQDDKGVQVDLQDLGYETSGKSENDREESSSTDLEVGANPRCSASSLPFQHEQATFSSTENLDSTSSTPYPSSPALSSAKVSLKSLQVYDEYGVSKDPLQLQGQVRELKVQLENQTKLILQMQSPLRRNSLSGELVANAADPSTVKDQEGTQRRDHTRDGGYGSGQLGEKKEGENQADKRSSLNLDLERESTVNRSMSEQLQQTRSHSTSPARLDSLVQSQARELSQLRQQIKESRRLGALQRRQLDELSKAFKELLQAGEVDYYMGEAVKEQLDKSLGILDRLEGRLDKGESRLVNEDVVALDLSRRLSKELQEKNRLIQSLQSQIRGRGPSSQHSSHSDPYHSDRTSSCSSSSSCRSSPASGHQADGQRHPSDWTGAGVPPVGGALEDAVSGAPGRLQGLQRENGRLQDRLRGSEELNASLRSELDLHRSIMAQTSSHHQEQDQDQDQDQDHDGSGPQTPFQKRDEDIVSQKNAAEQPRAVTSDLLAEHLQEIRVLRQRLEESIQTNDRLREQLEKRLAEVEKDPAATNIFIHGNEEQGQLTNEVRFLWGQNQVLKDQLSLMSKDKQKEREKLREALARRTAKLEQSRAESEELTQENNQLQERLDHSSQENSQLRQSVHRLQCEVKLQVQQLSDSQHLLRSLRVELQVYEKMKTEAHKPNEGGEPTHEATHEPTPVRPCGAVDLSELLLEIRRLRLQLERSIQTNTALRQRLEEQLLRGPNRSETININYLLSSPEEGGRSPGPHRHSFQSRGEHTGVLPDEKCGAPPEVDRGSFSSSSGDSVNSAPSRLVPGHRMWADRNGRHILGLIEDYNALRRQISEGRKLSRCMDQQLQESLHALKLQPSDNKVTEQQHLKSVSGSVSAMQHVLDEAGRMLKLVWRVSLPAGHTAGDGGRNQQDELLRTEILRLKSRLSQQERMLSGAVKRLRTTNQLKEGMEKVIIDQLYLTHGVLKKARGNLETHYCTLSGGSRQRPVGDPAERHPEQMRIRVTRRRSESSEEHRSDASLHSSS
ncbi:CDK5 regulatory subunit-associated protein 2 isoform X2 [Pseudoliparis swirei]|uniref:CDK5 regulatory subunit-associated protein 2 isoform X2 n=1 Tax=Pseudoliparis swirei TaxID=2059687 RepID=UPI0024BDA349|nr:CDK5 regulatory subunit-associated protein 2 isoform X2 [Pseudoliparis swirei]